MGKVLRRLGLGLLAIIVVLGLVAASPPGRGFIGEKLALRDGAQAYLIGYPLVTMQATRQALVQPPAQMNAFIHARYLPDARNAVNVISPSRDTVYSTAWLDLRDGPVIIEQPDMGDRFWLMPVLDAWTNVVADPGSRTLGNAPHTLLIAGPDWTGQAPAGVTLYRSTTNLAWAILRIQVDDGLDGIAELQDGFRIAPLSNRREYRDPAVVERPREVTDVRAAVDALTGEEFFTALADQLRDQPLVPGRPCCGGRPGQGRNRDRSAVRRLRLQLCPTTRYRRGSRPGATRHDGRFRERRGQLRQQRLARPAHGYRRLRRGVPPAGRHRPGRVGREPARGRRLRLDHRGLQRRAADRRAALRHRPAGRHARECVLVDHRLRRAREPAARRRPNLVGVGAGRHRSPAHPAIPVPAAADCGLGADSRLGAVPPADAPVLAGAGSPQQSVDVPAGPAQSAAQG
ncbi:MAG: DUF1254 domain-containing protein [Micrococcales bacterium]|nr:DUF1254 domain-containing protein [Micrococcales bacterium]